MMQNISFMLICLSISLFANVNELTYISKTSSNSYFTDMNNSEIDVYCNEHHGGRMEQDFCAKRIFEKSESQLNSTYKSILNKYKLPSDREKKILKKILKSQSLWFQYQEVECYTQYKIIGDGTMKNEAYFWCKSLLTQEREKLMREFYLEVDK